jgi:EAL domain-containing protein (putative c-di-GMP-specific phosphodiesterase class I)
MIVADAGGAAAFAGNAVFGSVQWGVMFSGVIFGVEASVALPAVSGVLGLGKGAIIGAMLVSAAFLAGIAVLRRSAAAFCGLLMLAAAGALQAVWLDILPAPAPTIVLLLQGLFAAATLIFLSSTIAMVGRSQLLGGLMFAGALSMVGIGVINAVLAGEASGVLHLGLTAVAATALGVSAFAGARGDIAARLILPGAVLAVAAPLLFDVAGASGIASLAPQAIFAIGVLVASLVALGDFNSSRAPLNVYAAASAQFSGDDQRPTQRAANSPLAPLRVSENQLAQVLDYSGVSVWDWNRSGSHQTASFASLMGADSDGAFTPEIFRDFVHANDAARFGAKVFGASEGDGGFDEIVRLHSGKSVRMRGARAVDHAGNLERIVVFLEEASPQSAANPQKNDSLKLAAASLTAAAATYVKQDVAEKRSSGPDTPATQAGEPRVLSVDAAPDRSVASAIENNELVAAFQPIVCFDSGKPCGAEALVRWPSSSEARGKLAKTEDIVRLAQQSGKGRALATIMLNATADHVAARLEAGEKGFFGAFNVSLSQAKEEGFADEVRRAMQERKLPKGSLVLELTEGEKLGETPRINETFKKLKAAGALLAYDDFGAGFSSLSNLHRYDFDYLKIDKSFIDDIVANGGKKKIVSALARLGRDFGMIVIAEGIETREAAETAKEIGCRMGQGYYLGEPAFPEAEVTIEPIADKGDSTNLATPEAASDASDAQSDVLVLNQADVAPKQPSRLFRRRLF